MEVNNNFHIKGVQSSTMVRCDLSKVRLNDIIQIPNISIRLKNCILVASENIDFHIDTIQDFLDSGDQAKATFLKKVDNMGLKSFNELDNLITTIVYINDNGSIEFDSISLEEIEKQQFIFIKNILSICSENVSRDKSVNPKNNVLLLSLSELVKTNICSVRLKNSIINAEIHNVLPFNTIEEYLKEGRDAIRKMLSVSSLGKGTALELDKLITEISSKGEINVSKEIFESSTDEIIKFILNNDISVRLRNALVYSKDLPFFLILKNTCNACNYY